MRAHPKRDSRTYVMVRLLSSMNRRSALDATDDERMTAVNDAVEDLWEHVLAAEQVEPHVHALALEAVDWLEAIDKKKLGDPDGM